jgi:hypothetical protein
MFSSSFRRQAGRPRGVSAQSQLVPVATAVSLGAQVCRRPSGALGNSGGLLSWGSRPRLHAWAPTEPKLKRQGDRSYLGPRP